MGEAKQRRENLTDAERLAEDIQRKLANEGKILEGGWAALRMMVMPSDASEVQVHEMRKAYFAGAQHLFSTMMVMLDPGEEPTDADMRKMDLIAAELEAWTREMKLEMATAKGQA